MIALNPWQSVGISKIGLLIEGSIKMIRNKIIYLISFFVLLYFCISFFIYLRVRSSRERNTFEEENHREKNEIYVYRVEIDNHWKKKSILPLLHYHLWRPVYIVVLYQIQKKYIYKWIAIIVYTVENHSPWDNQLRSPFLSTNDEEYTKYTVVKWI